MSNDTETAMSSTGSVKIPLFKGDGTGVSFEDYWNKLEAGLEYNCLEHCIEAGFKATTKEEIEKEADTTKQEKLEKKYKEDHKARAIIKLSVDRGPLTMIKNCASAFEMVSIWSQLRAASSIELLLSCAQRRSLPNVTFPIFRGGVLTTLSNATLSLGLLSKCKYPRTSLISFL